MTQRIHPQARVTTPVEFTGKKVLFPNAPDEYGVSVGQYGTIRTFATTESVTTVDPDAANPSQTIADAYPRWSSTMEVLRNHFRTTRDYDIVGRILAVWAERSAPKEVSVRQFDYAMDLVGYLTDPSTANPRVERALRQLPDEIRNSLRLRGISVTTNGQFGQFRRAFWAMIPRDTEAGQALREEYAGTDMGEGAEPPVEPPSVGDERY